MKDREILYATDDWERRPSDYVTEKKRGYTYPARMVINVKEPECGLSGELRSIHFNYMLHAMEFLPSFIRPVARKFLNAPVFIRSDAVVDWRLVMPGRGIDRGFTTRGEFETSIVN